MSDKTTLRRAALPQRGAGAHRLPLQALHEVLVAEARVPGRQEAGRPDRAESPVENRDQAAGPAEGATARSTDQGRARSRPAPDRIAARATAEGPAAEGPGKAARESALTGTTPAATRTDAVPGHGDRPRGSFRDFKTGLRVWLTGIAPGKLTATDLAQKVGEDAVAAYQRGELSLDQLQYRAIDARGFIGYRFGEEVLQILGYYRPTAQTVREWQDLSRLPPGARWSRIRNRWDGQFTGLQGAFSLKDFAAAGVQEIAIGEAFAWHLQQLIGLLPDEMGLGDMVGLRRDMDPPPGSRGASRSTCTVTISGILAAAQCYGATPVATYLLGPAAPRDPMAQSIHRMMSEFAGYATPYDTIPRPTDSDVGSLIDRVRGHSIDPFWMR